MARLNNSPYALDGEPVPVILDAYVAAQLNSAAMSPLS
jgi:hypothetical protein